MHVVGPASRCFGEAEADGGVEIILGQGRTVRVQAGFDRQTLAAVLAVLVADNPLGQSDEMTPFCIVRRK